MNTKKSLGQHWLFDSESLELVVRAAEVGHSDTVLEIGPGTGSLTALLAKAASRVIAVEKDADLIEKLKVQEMPNVEVIEGDILEYDLNQLPANYKVAANIPYYLTSNLVRKLLESSNPPLNMALLVQKEVAERIAAVPGQMSVLACSVQYYAHAEVVGIVTKEKFVPPPKVDSAVIQIKLLPRPYFDADSKKLFRLIKAGFGERRKQLKNSLAGGLHASPATVSQILKNSDLNETARAQELSMDAWAKLYVQATNAHLI